MTPVFTINFRREAFLREQARTRRRLFTLGGWVTYFGILGLIVGLYGLNCASLARRVHQVERHMARLRAAQGTRQDWVVEPAQIVAVEQFQGNPRRWRDKLLRLTTLLPPNAVLVSVAGNPDNLNNPLDQNKLVIVGQLRSTPGQDMQGVVLLASRMRSDSLFSRGFQNIRLVSSRALQGPGTTEFVIECR
jgi:hypothetical protein